MGDWVRAAVWGALAGATLGGPISGRRPFLSLNYYEPIPTRMAPHPGLDAWLVAARHLQAGKPPQTYSGALLECWNYPIEESAFGLKNAQKGLSAPIAGQFRNPLGIGSQAITRCLFWGLALRGSPDLAGEYAFYDASSDHWGDGVWMAVLAARLASLLGSEAKFPDVVRIAASSLPEGSALAAALPELIKLATEPHSVSDVAKKLPDTMALADPQHAALTMANALIGLSQMGSRFDKAVLSAVGCGGAAEQSGPLTGCLAALMLGEVPPDWTSPLGEAYLAGHGLRGLDPPNTLTEFAETVLRVSALHVVEPASPPAEGETTPTAAAPSPNIGDRLRGLLKAEPNENLTRLDGLEIAVQHIDPPVVFPEISNRFSLRFANFGAEEVELAATLSPPEGWKLATRLSSMRLKPGESGTYPAVVQALAGEPSPVSPISLKVNRYELMVPLFGAQRWYAVGPFVNHDGIGFDKAFPCEGKLNTSQVFNGRSELPVKWTETYFPGVVFDVEPLFRTGPGVVYLCARVKFSRPGPLRLVVGTDVGCIAWADGKKLLWYHDVHAPVPRATAPYLGEFTTTGESTLMVKVLRNRIPLGPLTLYLLGEDGHLVEPVSFLPLDP